MISDSCFDMTLGVIKMLAVEFYLQFLYVTVNKLPSAKSPHFLYFTVSFYFWLIFSESLRSF